MTENPMAPRCTAKSKQTGEQCRQRPVPGGTVCRFHGGAAPQVKAKAEERQQVARAEGEIRKLWAGLGEATAVTDPVASMARLAGALEQLLDEVGAKVNEITHLSAGENLSQLRGEVVLLERTAALLGRLLDAMARLGVEERKVEFQQAQAEVIVGAFRAALAAVASSVLLPGDRDLMLRAFLGALGVDVPPAEVEA